jgi:hypothetical protein
MKKYVVEITETLQKQVIIDAHSYDEARSIAKQKYKYEEIVLDENDHIDTEFKVISKIRNKEYMER